MLQRPRHDAIQLLEYGRLRVPTNHPERGLPDQTPESECLHMDPLGLGAAAGTHPAETSRLIRP